MVSRQDAFEFASGNGDRSSLSVERLRSYNGYYKRPDIRRLIYTLYKGVCQASGRKINLTDAEVGHIVPRSKGTRFETLFPGLDVDNLVNLHLLEKGMNRRVSNFTVDSPLFIYNAISYNARLIQQRLPKVQQERHRFNPQKMLHALLRPLVIDLTSLYKNAQCFGTYHLVPRDDVLQAYKWSLADACDSKLDQVMLIAGGGGRRSDALLGRAANFPHSDYIKFRVGEGRILNASWNITSDGQELREAQHMIDKGFVSPKRLKNHTFFKMPDGQYFLFPGPLKKAPQQCQVIYYQLSNTSHVALLASYIDLVDAEKQAIRVKGHSILEDNVFHTIVEGDCQSKMSFVTFPNLYPFATFDGTRTYEIFASRKDELSFEACDAILQASGLIDRGGVIMQTRHLKSQIRALKKVIEKHCALKSHTPNASNEGIVLR